MPDNTQLSSASKTIPTALQQKSCDVIEASDASDSDCSSEGDEESDSEKSWIDVNKVQYRTAFRSKDR